MLPSGTGRWRLPDKERNAVHQASYEAAQADPGRCGRDRRDQPDDMKPSDAAAFYHAVEAARYLFESEDSAPRLAEESLRHGRESVWYSDYSHDHKQVRAEEQAQCDLIREVIGSPFRKVRFLKKWRTDTAVALARQMYESREFSAMPILADALQETGCDNEDVLNHCRGPGPHVRGCWVVDLVLGKE